jgi:hypothetical protein
VLKPHSTIQPANLLPLLTYILTLSFFYPSFLYVQPFFSQIQTLSTGLLLQITLKKLYHSSYKTERFNVTHQWTPTGGCEAAGNASSAACAG